MAWEKIGDDVWIQWYSHKENTHSGVIIAFGADPEDIEGSCFGSVPIRDPEPRACWTLVSETPLTLLPSINCGCQRAGHVHHGWIREGRWVSP